jgi:NAD(P)-dependent dehydrogenase (short-subunit alcohol dehydrogenase family)
MTPSLPLVPSSLPKGKAVVVTGGGTGIGAETALHFAQAGASRIALLGRREQPLLDTKAAIEQKFPGIEIFVASTDVINKSEVDAAIDKFAGTGKLHVLISNAANGGPQVPIMEVDCDNFLGSIQQNISGSLYAARAFLRHAATDPVIIDVNSSAAHMNFLPKFGSYSTGKLAVYRLFDSLTFENPEISVFHNQPGVVDTAMNREAGGVAALGFADDSEWE